MVWEASNAAFTNLEQLEGLARPKLAPMVYGYYASGADTESTVRDNRAAFARYRLLPRMMVDVSHLDPSCKLLGKRLAFPVIVAPMAMQQMAHPDGELAVARACASAGIPMGVSTMGTYEKREVMLAGAGVPFMMYQLYVFRDRDFVRDMVQDAERAGYTALAVTVDAPFLGNREADTRNSFKLPEGMFLRNVEGLVKKLAIHHNTPGSGLNEVFSKQIDASLTWDFMLWLRTVTKLPVYVKGILSAADAQLAVDHGVDGIIVSNHGGRQLDFAPAAIDMLPSIRASVGQAVPVLVDGGVRRGTDIIKALALGADVVLLGRPVLYALALDGQKGIEKALQTLRSEFELSMALCGCPSVRHITRSLVIAPHDNLAKL